jgi:hypothetical protein
MTCSGAAPGQRGRALGGGSLTGFGTAPPTGLIDIFGLQSGRDGWDQVGRATGVPCWLPQGRPLDAWPLSARLPSAPSIRRTRTVRHACGGRPNVI